MQWSDRELTAFGMSHRTAPPEPLFYVGTGAQPLSVKPSTVNRLQPAVDPELYLSLIVFERSHDSTSDP